MSVETPRALRKRDGYALVAVVVFVFVVTLVGLAFFSVASYETKGALYRQRSSEAFYLADGAIERARAKFLEDRSWRAGWSGVAAGRGTYDLALTDTTFGGYDDVVQLLATGHVQGATRDIEVMAQVPPTSLALPLLIMGDADIGGNLCLSGEAHINGDPGTPHLACGGTYTAGFPIYPPPIYTDSGHFPGATYYYVKGKKVGPNYRATIYDAGMIPIPGGSDLPDVTTYNNGSKTYTFSFDSQAKIADYFGDGSVGSGVFKRNAGDIGVVVNFGEPPDSPLGALYHALVFDGNSSSNVHSTIINSRFIGVTEAQRLDWNYWEGDDNMKITVKQVIFEPFYGIAIIAQNLERTGSAHAYLGTTAYPALVYITRDVVTINSNLDITGSLICLRDFHSTGGPNVTYNEGFIPNLPGYLSNGWPAGVSGTLKVLRWREVASTS
jgi:hypothetical protein